MYTVVDDVHTARREGVEMTVYDATIAKIQQLPEPLVQRVQDYVDYLLKPDEGVRWQAAEHVSEAMTLTESDITDYLTNLEDYEERLARGEVKW